MKKLYIVLILVFAANTIKAQNKDTAAADKLYISLEYVDAAEAYKKLVDDGKGSPYVYSQLAESYYNMFNYKEAAKWYAKVIETQQEAEVYYKYAQMLKADGKYEEANKQMGTFAAKAPNDQRAIEFKKDPNYLPKLRSQQKLYDLKNLNINSDKADFGAVLTNDNHLYFASARSKGRKKYGWNEEPFLDLYSSVMSGDGVFGEPQPVGEINSKFHDGPATISADGNTMYFASESFKEKEFVKDKKNNLRQGQVYIFKATKDGEKWGNIKEVSFNNKTYSVSNPSLSKDGKTLYFSSDMPGGQGGIDIWKVAVSGDGTYGTPENLGKKINTEGNESFPSITDDNKLFFSSDGRKGFGGLDVFMIDTDKDNEAKNVGLPVNSPKDDFAFSFNTAKNIGFFSSNRDGNDNLYIATPVCSVDVITTVKDALTGKALSNASVAILDNKKNIIETKTTNMDGIVVYTVDCDKEYSVQVTNDGYEGNVFPVAKTRGGKVDIAANLQPIEKIIDKEVVVLNDIFFEFNKSNVTKEGAYELDKLIQVMVKYPNMEILVKSHTDNRGSDQYNLSLSDRRAKSTVQYILSKGVSKTRISGKGYGESEPNISCTDCTEEQHAQNRRSEFLIVKQ
ncbi:MAG: cell envelope biogenesis protein OmpA [Flavobacterium sp. BFFFF1]|uniref:OmpA family protein n=1 Tax=Flavobacterium sp. BFFFF1 TaxID=2015557 RepID=UPI000BC5F277|nr:OmpA family protein [Flavobacterium sp. BFFFF1]OYU79881.1 MAG: cell envelope biogenesis protein OmpA [Flavobacterium sp. BFFFF1]